MEVVEWVKEKEIEIKSPHSEIIKWKVTIYSSGRTYYILCVESFGIDEEECDIASEAIARAVAYEERKTERVYPMILCAVQPSEEVPRFKSYFIVLKRKITRWFFLSFRVEDIRI